MRKFFVELHCRNKWLSIAGWISLMFALLCAIMTQVSDTTVLGINAYIKPMKFFLSICIFLWTMGWLVYYLQLPRTTIAYSITVMLVFILEMYVILWQASNGRLSHFNNTSPLYGLLFGLMGLAIILLWFATLVITILFFFKNNLNLSNAYLWGIRLGLLLFLIFSMEGAVMVFHFGHTVGGADGSAGLPVVNWSKQYGDLRVAHFIGMHALQILPLFAFFIAENTRAVMLFATFYFIFASVLFVQAMKAIPLFF